MKRFLTGPRGCEISGVIRTPDRRTMFVNVQHPGESTMRWNVKFGVPSPARALDDQFVAIWRASSFVNGGDSSG